MSKEAGECLNELGATKHQLYLGDSVYTGYDEKVEGWWIITWNGYFDDPRNKIYLDDSVLQVFDEYREALKQEGEQE